MGARLQGAKLDGAEAQGANLNGAQLQGAYLEGAQLQGADLRVAQLQGAEFFMSQLQGADLRGADLSVLPKGSLLPPLTTESPTTHTPPGYQPNISVIYQQVADTTRISHA